MKCTRFIFPTLAIFLSTGDETYFILNYSTLILSTSKLALDLPNWYNNYLDAVLQTLTYLVLICLILTMYFV